eukprot:m51a1_g8484 putative membrane-bound protein (487) ;mRNA; f:527288-530829
MTLHRAILVAAALLAAAAWAAERAAPDHPAAASTWAVEAALGPAGAYSERLAVSAPAKPSKRARTVDGAAQGTLAAADLQRAAQEGSFYSLRVPQTQLLASAALGPAGAYSERLAVSAPAKPSKRARTVDGAAQGTLAAADLQRAAQEGSFYSLRVPQTQLLASVPACLLLGSAAENAGVVRDRIVLQMGPNGPVAIDYTVQGRCAEAGDKATGTIRFETEVVFSHGTESMRLPAAAEQRHKATRNAGKAGDKAKGDEQPQKSGLAALFQKYWWAILPGAIILLMNAFLAPAEEEQGQARAGVLFALLVLFSWVLFVGWGIDYSVKDSLWEIAPVLVLATTIDGLLWTNPRQLKLTLYRTRDRVVLACITVAHLVATVGLCAIRDFDVGGQSKPGCWSNMVSSINTEVVRPVLFLWFFARILCPAIIPDFLRAVLFVFVVPTLVLVLRDARKEIEYSFGYFIMFINAYRTHSLVQPIIDSVLSIGE